MIKILLTFITITLFFNRLHTQVPDKMSYQAIIRDSTGLPIPNKNLFMKIGISRGLDFIYEEEHKLKSNKYGLIKLSIGEGKPLKGTFNKIIWSSGNLSMKTSISTNDGINYFTEPTDNYFQSVPFAFLAKESLISKKTEQIADGKKIGEILFWDGSRWIGLPLGKPGEYLSINNEGLIEWTTPNFVKIDSTKLTPTLTVGDITSIGAVNAIVSSKIILDGGFTILTKGVVWSTSPNPTISLTTKTNDGKGNNSFLSSITGLSPNTTYYIRAYASNIFGTGYSKELSFSTTSALSQGIPCPGTPTVKDIDDNIYNTIKIGTQCWTKENLKVTKFRDGSLIPLDETGGTSGNGTGQTWSSRTTGARTVYGHNATNFETYGYLYNWYAVNDSRGLCPTGWHVPTYDQWTVLADQLGGLSVAGGKMKVTGTIYWNSPNKGASNESGFGALPGGNRDYLAGQFGEINYKGLFWSSTELDQNFARRPQLNNEYEFLYMNQDPKGDGFPIRCLKDTTLNIVNVVPVLNTIQPTDLLSTSAKSGGSILSEGGAPVTSKGVVWSTTSNPTITLSTKTNDGNGISSFSSLITGLSPNTTYFIRAFATNSVGTGYGNELSFTTPNTTSQGIPCPGMPTVKDIDGNTYNTIQIGTQCWTKENLRVTRYNDGTLITLDASGGSNGNEGGQTWSNLSTGLRTIYGNENLNFPFYGYLYNWYAVSNTSGLCPKGWIMPHDEAWNKVQNFLGGENTAGGKMKETGTTYWRSPNTGATNESGFSALPGGSRSTDGSFSLINLWGMFWSGTEQENAPDHAWFRSVLSTNGNLYRYNGNKNAGLSVRCLKDTTLNIVNVVPVLNTIQPTDLLSTSAKSGGSILSEGGAPVTSKGVVWSTTSNPTITLSTKTNDGNGISSFSSLLTGLSPNTTYFIRAFATNSVGTGYGNELSFTTPNTTSQGIPCPGTPTVKDIDGNTYNTIQIGTQCWTKENLRVTRYNDGTLIPLDTSGGYNGDGIGQTWSNLNTGARTVYGNENLKLSIYGYLYNWYAAADLRGICPLGWRIPTNGDYSLISQSLGNENIAGGKLKETGITNWKSPNTAATNETGFTGLPGGLRWENGRFRLLSERGFFWSSSVSGFTDAWPYMLYYLDGFIYRVNHPRYIGGSLRCLKEK